MTAAFDGDHRLAAVARAELLLIDLCDRLARAAVDDLAGSQADGEDTSSPVEALDPVVQDRLRFRNDPVVRSAVPIVQRGLDLAPGLALGPGCRCKVLLSLDGSAAPLARLPGDVLQGASA